MPDLSLEVAEVLGRRIDNSKKTLPEVFAEVDRYVSAAFALYNFKPIDPKSRDQILMVQMLALELHRVAPELMVKVERDLVKFWHMEEVYKSTIDYNNNKEDKK